MKLIFSKNELLKSVAIVMKAVPSKTTMPILECILINAESDEIYLTTNDMELGIRTRTQGTIAERGSIAVDAKIFSDVIRKLPDNDITITSDDRYNTVITCEKSKINLAGKDPDEFTTLPEIEKEEYISISQFTLKEIIRQTIFSIAMNDNNKIMTGELFQITGDTLKVVALDGHRIAIRKIQLSESYGDKKVIVPGKTLQEISKILSGEADDKVNIFITKNHIVFEFDETVVVSRLIDGEYFKIDQMLSSDYETKVKVNKRDLLDCIDRSTLFVKEGDKKPIIINILDGYMKLTIESQLGSMDEDVDVDKEGKDILIGFNPKFLIDTLRVIDEDEITMYLVNPKAPCFIRDEKDSYTYLILPVNFTR